MSLIFSIWTVLVMVIFTGIVIWVWSRRNKEKYDAAARIPLEDDSHADLTEKLEDLNHV